MNVQLICGRVFGLIDGFLCELELICEDYVDEDQTQDPIIMDPL